MDQKLTPADQRADDISRRLLTSLKENSLRVTIDHIDQPAYMVNYNLEITWFNDAARGWLGDIDRLPEDSKARHILHFLSQGIFGQRADNQTVFNKLHWDAGQARLRGTAAATPRKPHTASAPIAEYHIPLCWDEEVEEHYTAYVSYFREGMLFVYVRDMRDDQLHGELLGLLARRDEVIRDLLKKQLPVLTELSVLVADLQGSTMISMQLPPEEYFELINQMWAMMEPVFRKYYGTHGKHVGDGMVYYFFPQPDCSYLFNAVQCANELREEMRHLSQTWELRKRWGLELSLKIGIHDGMEWLGTFHIDSKVEFTVLGDTINQAARLSDFARGGTLWASKSLISKLSPEDRRRVRYGIRRVNSNGVEHLVEATFAPVASLLENSLPGDKLRDINALPVTEIIELRNPA